MTSPHYFGVADRRRLQMMPREGHRTFNGGHLSWRNRNAGRRVDKSRWHVSNRKYATGTGLAVLALVLSETSRSLQSPRQLSFVVSSLVPWNLPVEPVVNGTKPARFLSGPMRRCS